MRYAIMVGLLLVIAGTHTLPLGRGSTEPILRRSTIECRREG